MARQNKQNKLGSQRHEWRAIDQDGEDVTYRAIHHGTDWRIIWSYRVGRSEELVWNELEQVSNEIWSALREILWRKYQRRRVPFELIEQMDRKLAKEEE